jgi:pyridoxal phosphate enzyme (YggS family)
MLENTAAQRLAEIRANIGRAKERFAPLQADIELVAVSKTFPAEEIVPFLDAGQRVFGENRVQEAKDKWPELKARFPDVSLHLIGPLQTNKVKEAVALFDVIETLDRERLAEALKVEMERAGRKLRLFVQVNIGLEDQKSGIAPNEAAAFVERCRSVHQLDILGLMCIPPAGEAPGPYFAHLAGLAKAAKVEKLSMGMSADYEVAIGMGATHVRVGSALFGHRI